MNVGPSGFNNAPVTRALVIVCTIFTIIFGVRGRGNQLGWSYQDIFQKLQIWKLIISAFTFSSTPELVFGLYLLYYFRVFERQIGSNKYSVFLLFSFVVSLLLEVLALQLIKDPSLSVLSGPYGLIFSSFVPFYLDIPVSTRFRLFSLHFSDKSFIYLAGLQLLFSSWKRSIVPGLCGIIAGCLYRLNFFRIRRVKLDLNASCRLNAIAGRQSKCFLLKLIMQCRNTLFPEFITSFFARLSWPSTGNLPPPSAPARNAPGNVPIFAGRQMEGNFPAPVSSTPEPPEDAISMLVSMGFDRNSARQALIHSRNDVNIATNVLLESQSH
ncbi:hypothetical protein H5410_053970 [Solanum commersonii]|uniref:UBA domain-containing protein n=1 Tax=Solanum commersonii TaxID=4109 RepID=A0A9J5X6H1_SOLCO|nr:hypothetical protein H5410_053970 [Solanum commersonii]